MSIKKRLYGAGEINQKTGLTSKDLFTYRKKGLIRESKESTDGTFLYDEATYKKIEMLAVLKKLGVKPSKMQEALNAYNKNPTQFVNDKLELFQRNSSVDGNVIARLLKVQKTGLSAFAKSMLLNTKKEVQSDPLLKEWFKDLSSDELRNMLAEFVHAAHDYSEELKQGGKKTKDIVLAYFTFVRELYGFKGMAILLILPEIITSNSLIAERIVEGRGIDLHDYLKIFWDDYLEFLGEEHNDFLERLSEQAFKCFYLSFDNPLSLDYEERICDFLFEAFGVQNRDYLFIYKLFLVNIYDYFRDHKEEIFKENGWEIFDYTYKLVHFYRVEHGKIIRKP
ncbi:MerR family transcriptional regulator [Butyrivibrio sp. WCD3002]|uniref:MerR family transcriptional regulator n=1 Tax=Butyrivibrio sp. WCD3002 TaxID=1280676 RepID=UPI00040E9599|nr:MerR family transcriptional regulator [Butyrivibrio sp. WCD3002]